MRCGSDSNARVTCRLQVGLPCNTVRVEWDGAIRIFVSVPAEYKYLTQVRKLVWLGRRMEIREGYKFYMSIPGTICKIYVPVRI